MHQRGGLGDGGASCGDFDGVGVFFGFMTICGSVAVGDGGDGELVGRATGFVNT